MRIDLLVAMGILVTLAAMAIPAYLNQVNRAHDCAAFFPLRTGLVCEIDYMMDKTDQGYVDLSQDSAFRPAVDGPDREHTVWYDGWSVTSPAVLQVDVRGQISSGSLVDDWLMLTVLSRSDTGFPATGRNPHG